MYTSSSVAVDTRQRDLSTKMFEDSPVGFSIPLVNTLFEEDDMELAELLTPNSKALRDSCQLSSDIDAARSQKFKIRKPLSRKLFSRCKSFDDRTFRGSPSFDNFLPTVMHETQSAPCAFQDSVVIQKLEDMSTNENLVGDGTEVHNLPTVCGKHKDLKSIIPETLHDLMCGTYNGVVDDYLIIDCRYPYEYNGGHIKGALNLYTEALIETLFNRVCQKQRTVLIFHCEFSSERGPKLLRYLRSCDRTRNADNYPKLFYPEVYILDGGYKAFFGKQKEGCQPQAYVSMFNKEYSEDMRHFRKKSKSWNGHEQRRQLRF